jgi:hypothetical protein
VIAKHILPWRVRRKIAAQLESAPLEKQRALRAALPDC